MLRQVELVRKRVISGQASELARLRVWVSTTDGNNEAVEQLKGPAAEQLLADICELIMLHLGHCTDVTRLNDGASGVASQARKAARGRM